MAIRIPRKTRTHSDGLPFIPFAGINLGTIIQCKDTDTSWYCNLAKIVNSIIMILMLFGILYFIYYLYRTFFSKRR